MTMGVHAQGAILRFSVTENGSYVAVPGLKTIEETGGPTIDMLDDTAHDSPDGYEEKVAGIIRAGQITATGSANLANAAIETIKGHLDSKTNLWWEIVRKTRGGGTVTFKGKGYVASALISDPHDGLVNWNLTLERDGKWAKVTA